MVRVAAIVYGVELEPGDLDVTPALDAANLKRLSTLLVGIGAVPEDLGHWETKPNGERRWICDDNSAESRLAWEPDAEDPTTFDHLFSRDTATSTSFPKSAEHTAS